MSRRSKNIRTGDNRRLQKSAGKALADNHPAISLQNPKIQQLIAVFVVCCLLVAAVYIVFGQTGNFNFVNYDDDEYVYNNQHVNQGLTASGFAWALTAKHSSNWHPLTWLSHMVDCQMYGLTPGNHHITNSLIHALSSVLLFLILRSLTGNLWPSAFAAAVFAVHPLHVESVAWISERKDVLSGLLFMLTIWAYIGYVRHKFSLIRYLLVIVSFVLGLMAKPMLVSLPLVLLLLDYWPLGRTTFKPDDIQPLSTPPWRQRLAIFVRLIVEKIPLFVLSAASCVVTIWAQSGAIAVNEKLSIPLRFENAAISYVTYIYKLFYPAKLCVFYPHPYLSSDISIWQAAASLAVIVAISVFVVWLWKKCPYLLTGWLWYLVMLVPVIGIVQVGWVEKADRYTYLPQIGLYIAIAWGVMRFTKSWPFRAWICGISAALIISTLIICARNQASYWCDSESLWKQALACTTQNYVAHTNLGKFYILLKRKPEAFDNFQKAIQIKYELPEVHSNLGAMCAESGNIQGALKHYQQALDFKPDMAEVYFNLALLYESIKQPNNALAAMRKAKDIAQSKGQEDLVKLIDSWLHPR